MSQDGIGLAPRTANDLSATASAHRCPGAGLKRALLSARPAAPATPKSDAVSVAVYRSCFNQKSAARRADRRLPGVA